MKPAAPRRRSSSGASAATAAAPRKPERWSADAGAGDVCRLDIPADAVRERRFEIACLFVVAHPGGGSARHGLTVTVDGAREWSREIETHDGRTDTLDVRFHRTVPAGRALRVVATGSVQRARRVRLAISADEE
jgi:hypothetical protein